MDLITKYIYTQVANKNLSQQDAKSLLFELKALQDNNIEDNDIAVIGMAGQFPKAHNLNEFWKNIKNGRNCIDKIPESRIKDTEDYLLRFHTEQIKNDNLITADGRLNIDYEIRGYLYEVDKFDANFFNIPPREACAMDPKQRQLLQITNDALENAGYYKNNIYGTKTGVFIGLDHVCEIKYKLIARSDPLVVTGTWPSILASRISFIYNLQGPCVVSDTACSSGLVSVHLACTALKNKECHLAIAGGLSSVFYKPYKFSDEKKDLSSIESKNNKVCTFDKKANGTVWGEGAGIVILKSLNKAIEDGDVIHAVIKGHGINNDGASNGITAPDAGAQEELILTVWKKSGINPETIQYIEAHGTGTVLGDPIEVKALSNAFRKYTDKKQFCGIGSVKTNIGHTVGASGIASLLKVILMIKHKTIVPSINFSEPNPYINFKDSPVYITNYATGWDSNGTPRRAGINSFGFAGTNCHVLVEEPPVIENEKFTEDRKQHLFTISAKNINSLKKLIDEYIQFIAANMNLDIADICYTANTGRGHYNYRLILVITDLNDLKEKLLFCKKNDLDVINVNNLFYGYHKIVSEGKANRKDNELTEGERRKLNSLAKEILKDLLKNFNENSIETFCNLYIKGASYNWDILYLKKRKRISLPSYPFEKTRYWYEEKEKSKNKSAQKFAKEILHPLVDRCLVESMYQDIYITAFSIQTHWIIKEHVIVKQNVIPGISYIELIHEIAKKYFGDSPIHIQNMYFYLPVILKPGEVRDVQTIINKGDDEMLHFICASKIEENEFDEKWVKHVEGKVSVCHDKMDEKINKAEISRKIFKEKPIIDLSNKGYKKVIELGPRWQCEKVIGIGESNILIELKLPDQFTADLDSYSLHPALLDNAINAVSQRMGKGLYLPFMYKSIKIFGNIPENFYSLVTMSNRENMIQNESPEVITFSVSMFHPEGNVFIKIDDYKIKKVNVEKSSFNQSKAIRNKAFSLEWKKSENILEKINLKNENILFFKNNTDTCERIQDSIHSSGSHVIKVKKGKGFSKIGDDYSVGNSEEDYIHLLKDIKSKEITKIIHAFTIKDKFNKTDSFKELKDDLNNGLKSLLNFIRALSSNRVSDIINIYILFNYAYKADGMEKIIYPQNASIPVFSKVVMEEFPYIDIKCIDIDGITNTDIIVHDFFYIDNGPNLVSYRNNQRYIQEFTRRPIQSDDDFKLSNKGIYLITGGTGGLGSASGIFLAENGAKNICLLGRSEFPERNKWDTILKNGKEKKIIKAINAIKNMEKNNATVVYKQADVSDYDTLEPVIKEVQNKYRRIAGIIHCAGIGGKGILINKTEEKFDSVIAPKIQGTWNIDHVTRKDNPDFFILFSSILSIFPEAGQIDYASANAYMDSFAVNRNMSGLKTIAINWPAWMETGMALNFNVDFSNSIFNPLNNNTALFYLKEILKSNMSNILPGEINYSTFSKVTGFMLFKLSDKILLAAKKFKLTINDNNDKFDNTEIIIKGKDSNDYNEVENTLARIWSNILGIKEIDIYDTLSNLGGDSMIAIELHKMIDKIYPQVIDIADIFSYPSINQISEHIKNKLNLSQQVKHVKDTSVESAGSDTVDNKLKDILDSIELGNSSIDNALDEINKIL